MRLYRLIDWPVWTILFVGIAAEFAVLLLALRKKLHKSLIMLPVTAGYSFAADVGAVLVLFLGTHYKPYFWTCQAVGAGVTMLLSLQLLSVIVRLKDVTIAWSLVVASALLLVGYIAIPGMYLPNLFAFSAISDGLSAAALLLAAMSPVQRWRRIPGLNLPVLVASVVVPSLLHLGFGIIGSQFHVPALLKYWEPLVGPIQAGFYLLALLCPERKASVFRRNLVLTLDGSAEEELRNGVQVGPTTSAMKPNPPTSIT
jgi:hypothetical protein